MDCARCSPSESKLRVLCGRRDTLPDNRQMSALELTYNFSKAKAGEIVPDFCLLSSLLYESTYESQLWMLYDSNKQLIDCGDAYTHQVGRHSVHSCFVMRAAFIVESSKALVWCLSVRLTVSPSIEMTHRGAALMRLACFSPAVREHTCLIVPVEYRLIKCWLTISQTFNGSSMHMHTRLTALFPGLPG